MREVIKIELWQLQQRRSLPLEAKIEMSKRRITEWYEHYDGQVYISFSGGKDSTVLAHLVRSMYPDVPLVFCNTGLEYPELVEFVKCFENVEIMIPQMNFVEVIRKYGFPVTTKEQAHYIKQYKRNPTCPNSIRILTGTNPETGKISTFKLSQKWQPLLTAPFKVSDECCKVMKKQPFYKYERKTKRKPYIGIVGGESIIRDKNYLKTGCNAFDNKRPQSQPLAFWTEQDILNYMVTYHDDVLKIVKDGLKAHGASDAEIAQRIHPWSSVYGDIINYNGNLMTTGVSRTGCIFCMFGVHLDPTPNRFQQLKSSHVQLWNYCMYKLGLAEVLEFIGVEYGQQITFDELESIERKKRNIETS